MAAGGNAKKWATGNYNYSEDTGVFHYVKKTGYLVKSPSSLVRISRWRRRWFMLFDLVTPDSTTGMPSREIRLEYYTENPGTKGKVKPKGRSIRIF